MPLLPGIPRTRPKVNKLPLVVVAARVGDLDRAEAALAAITDTDKHAYALAELLDAAAGAGDFDRAEAVAEAITDPNVQAQALARLAEAAEGANDLDRARALAARAEAITDRAEAAARAIADLDERARALSDLAGKTTAKRARRLLAQVLVAGHWEASLIVLVKTNPAAVSAIVDEYLSQ